MTTEMGTWVLTSERLPEIRDKSYRVAAICEKRATMNYAGQGVQGIYQDWNIRMWPKNFRYWMEMPQDPDFKESSSLESV